MIKQLLLVLLACAVFSSACSQETTNQHPNPRPMRRGASAGYGSRDATVLSMMGWGLGLAVGIATLCALIPDNDSSSSSHGH